MGHSLGGRTAMYVAGKYPKRLDGLICIDIPPVDQSSDADFGKDALSILRFLVEHEGKRIE
jgi:pimeloyl-ACP methyl ester carboxylesterase